MTDSLPSTAVAEEPDDLHMTGVAVGDVLAGKYEVDQVLGAGGMGVVVRATHKMLKSKVAMKFLLPEYVNNSGIVERFLREARAAVSIKNQHVAGVIDVGTLESGSPYIVMEYLQGRDLEDVLDAETYVQDTYRAGTLILQACEGLAAAHASGIVHRDIKPGNLFITNSSDGSEQVKVLDFGISKSGTELNNLTRTGAIMGSPMYMSPEQMRSTRNVDQRSDVWSLGVVAFEIFTGRLPYEAETMTELVAMVLEHDPPRTRMLRANLPEAFDNAVAGALTKNPDERYRDIGEFAQAIAEAMNDQGALEHAARIRRILSRGTDDLTGAHASQSAATPLSRSHIRTKPEEEKGNSKMLIGVALVVALVAAAGLGAYFSGGDEPAAGSTVTPDEAPMEVPIPDVPSVEEQAAAEAARAAEAEAAAAAAADLAAAQAAAAAAQAAAEAAQAAAEARNQEHSSSSGSRSHRSRAQREEAASAMMDAPPPTMTSPQNLLLDRN